MARSLVGGLIANGYSRDAIVVSDLSEDARKYVAENFSVRVEESNHAVVAASSTVVLALKPQVMQGALSSVANSLQSSDPLLISIAAGIRLGALDSWSGGNLSIVRVMPNTPALIQKGVSAMYANPEVSDEKTVVQNIMSAVGKTVWLPDERLLDAVTAVSGSGPAYFFYLIECIEEAAIELGLEPETAHLLATETAVGAALLSITSSESPSVLRQRVTSPGGTTAAALNVLNEAEVRQSIISAIRAAEKRSIEMSQPASAG